MRKLLSVLLAVIMLLSLSVPALASETSSDRAELIELACDVFPEYEDKILSSNSSASTYSRTQAEPVLIVNESRAVSESETLLYTEYSDGTVLLTDWEVTAKSPTVTIEDRYSSSFAVNYTVTLKATCTSVTGYYKLQNVKFSLINSAYDEITDTGTEVLNEGCTNSSISCKPIESTTPANISCDLIFRYADYASCIVQTKLKLNVSNDSYSVSHERID